MTLDRISGCLLGLALGDALGAPYEGGFVERLAWKAIGRTRDGRMRWSDDTQMSIDVAESLIACRGVDPDDLAMRFARSYRWSRGYGPGAARTLKRIRRGEDWRAANRAVYREGSFGNGGAMRSPVLGVFYADRQEQLLKAVEQTAIITHAHELGIEGARLIAVATGLAAQGLSSAAILQVIIGLAMLEPFRSRLVTARYWFESDQTPETSQVAQMLGNGIAAAESCVTALYLAMRFLDKAFLDMHNFIIQCRGDVDTIAAMAGGIWGAANGLGALPHQKLQLLEDRERLIKLAGELGRAAAFK
jgi:ADP-ribosylglycohydrolase